MTPTVEALTGDALRAVLPDLARLRMAVFRDWPYLYDGSEAYEAEYLAKFASGRGAVCIVARDGDRIIGASTASPMAETDAEFRDPFLSAGYDIASVFYCGESVLLPEYRGHGLGHAFFDGREGHARQLGGFAISTFCRVVRPDDHPLKPRDYRPLDGFWTKRGYAPRSGLVARYAWTEVGQDHETDHTLQFWLKDL
ncbi:MAG: GNAT family N-acetyltransferase [Hyphomicrobiaceae bacterium]|nr:GNAT family N-acetyltransferase [Hyphomicrobiaceae bacterium]